MIKADHHPFFVWFFKHYSRLMIKWHFREVHFEGDMSSPKGPVLIVANHFSWWDGFLINHLNHKFWHKRFHVMMEEKQLRKRRFLSKTGAFSLAVHSNSAITTLRYALELLQHPGNLLVLFPQGHFTSQSAHPLRFEEGARFFFRNSAVHVKMVVMLIDYFSYRRPFVSIYVKDFQGSHESPSLEGSYNRFYNLCVEKQTKKALI